MVTLFAVTFYDCLVVEQTDTGKCHSHSVFIAGSDHVIISHGAARLGNVFHAALISTLDIITEWEKCIGSKDNIYHLIQPCAFFLSRKYFRLLGKGILPCTICKKVHILFADVQIDGIISVCTSDGILKRQI